MHDKLAVNLDTPINAAMAKGTALEPMARAYYCDHRKVDVEPACLQSSENPWMRASVDGICFDDEIVVEIKCGESAYRHAHSRRTVPEHYYPQLQHILAVTGYKSIDFWAYWPGKRPVLLEARRNESFIKLLVEKETEFWRFIERDVMKRLSEQES